MTRNRYTRCVQKVRALGSPNIQIKLFCNGDVVILRSTLPLTEYTWSNASSIPESSAACLSLSIPLGALLFRILWYQHKMFTHDIFYSREQIKVTGY